MARFFIDRAKAKGQAPGSLILLGEQKMDKPVFQLMQYQADKLIEKECNTIEEAIEEIEEEGVTWINIYGIHDLGMIRTIGEKMNLHSLMLEDILNTDQRPKFEESVTYTSFILKYLYTLPDSNEILSEQISVVLGNNFVLTLQERTADFLNPVRQRIRENKTRIRLRGNDYLAYAILDVLVDTYAELLENVGRRVEDLEDKIFGSKDKLIPEEIYRTKTELNFLRKSVRPVKEISTKVLNSDNTIFSEDTRVYFQNLNGIITHITETIELYNGMVSDQLNVYNTNVSNSMNSVMKVLTVFASVFIPLTFFAGVYGMNFDNIPELHFQYGYHLFWSIIIVIGVSLLIYFKRKKWL